MENLKLRRERHGCDDVVVGTRNDDLRVLVGRKYLLAVLRPAVQSDMTPFSTIVGFFRGILGGR
eukprot:1912994-Rhodomonas_salina.1